ncbi:hypothetical protein [Pseudooceanicola marinus]|uniref:hypothetical protein n=1 Tax=Pseudooceanicola marinus TaxID=396013 RepID=UPI001CD43619|nr:hypothetical protein [Pseudooceanicola marinus]MCA1337047.1 hypothetical protein [Pseudooceanicola marinus]
MEAGRRFRTHMWARAQASRAEAKLPMAIHRSRIARAKELGLSYSDYSAIRATSGRDIAGYLISSNALGVQADRVTPQASVTERLMALRHVQRVGLAHPPLSPAALLERVAGLDLAFAAPPLLGSWPEIRAALARAQGRLPAAGLVAITALGLERDWVTAGGLAGSLPAEALFG